MTQKSVPRSEISEEILYIIHCPYCGDIVELDDESDNEAFCGGDGCNNHFTITDN